MKQQKLLVIALHWPEPQATAAGGRILQLLQFFLDQGYIITMASTATKSELSFDLNTLGIKRECIQLNHSSFDTFVQELQPDVVLFDRFITEEQFGWRVAEFAPNALRILDTEDLHSLRHAREMAFKKGRPFTRAGWLQEDKTKREIASIYRSDLSLIISSYEMELLLSTFKIDQSLLLHLPFMLPKITKEQSDAWPPFENRKDFICIGNGKHAPNIDAIVWLKKEIWPLIHKALPEANLHIYGAYLPEHIKQMHKPSTGFFVQGWVENKAVVFHNARINLAPLRFGAGIKGKLIDAMQSGTPSVTTTIGVEGMYGDLDWSGSIANTSEQFAKDSINLYTHKVAWVQAQQNGRSIINQIYNIENLHEVFAKKVNTLLSNLHKHREQNFVGVLLHHQTMSSSKFMAKWIEEKNR